MPHPPTHSSPAQRFTQVTRALPKLGLLLVLLGGLALTGVFWQQARLAAVRQIQADLQHDADDIRSRIERYLDGNALLLRGFEGLFNASARVSRQDFHQYFQTLREAGHTAGFAGVAYHALVLAPDLPRHVATLKKEGFADYRVHPESAHPVKAPLVYIEPMLGNNLKVIGFDPLTVPVERTAIEQARDSAGVAMSAKLTLAQDVGDPLPGFVMYVPIYRHSHESHADVAARRRDFAGWVDAPFRMVDLIARVLPEGLPDLHLEIYDGLALSPAGLLLDAGARPSSTGPTAPQVQQILTYGGHTWTLAFYALPDYGSAAVKQKPGLIASSGILLSLLLSWALAWVLRAQQRQQKLLLSQVAEAEQQARDVLRAQNEAALLQSETAARQTEAQAHAALEQLVHQKYALDQHAIVSTTNVQGLITYANDKFCSISGYPREALIGRDHDLLNSGRHPKGFFRGLYETLARGEVWHGEICNRAQNGHLFWVHTTILNYLDEAGQSTQYIAISNDITERRATELELAHYRDTLKERVQQKTAELQHQQSLLNATLNATAEGIIVLDQNDTVLLWNQRFVDLWHIPAALVERPDTQLGRLHMQSQAADPAALIAATTLAYQNPGHSPEALINMADGRVLRRSVQAQKLGDEVVGWVWSYADISELAQQKEALRQIEKRFELAVDGADIGIWDMDFTTGTLYNSPRMWQMLGYREDQFNPSLAAWELLAFPGDFAQVMEAFLASLENPKQAIQLTPRYRHRNGSWHWIAVNGRASANAHGEFTRITGTHTDITERKKMEAALYASRLNLKMLTNSVPGAVYQFEVSAAGKWKTVFVSQGIEALFEVSVSHVLHTPQALTDCILPADREAHQRSLAACSLALCLWDNDYRIQTASGSIKWINVRATPKRRSDASTLWNGILSDVTASKRTEQAAQAANLAKSEFLANMSHEIRTPMNGVIGMLDILQQTRLLPTQRRMVDTVVSSSQLLLQILNDILDYSKIEAGQLTLEHMATSLHEVTHSVLQLMHGSASARGLMLSLSIAPELPAAIYADPTRLRQVLLNLVGNAIKFTPAQAQHENRVTLSLEPGALPNGEQQALLLRVVDQGIGMSAEVVARLFQPFTQADAGTARQFGGTGLGLSICHRLVLLMGGQITVQSTPGAGSVFSVLLPLYPAPIDTTTALPMPLFQLACATPGMAPANPNGHLILLAEDNETNSDVLREQLRLLGYTAEVATDGVIALEKWRNGHYALLLTDCHMPHMDGFDLTAAIRAEEAPGTHLPIIAVTANALQGQAQRCLAHGMDDYLSKPLRLQALAAMLAKWLPVAVDTERPDLSPDVPSDFNAEAASAGAAPQAAPDSLALPLPDWDADMLGRLVGDNPALQQRLLEKFLRQTVEQINAIETASQTGDTQAVALVAHTLKSAARSMGALALGELCQHIETAGQAADAACCMALTSGLGNTFAQARQRIEAHLAQPPTAPF